ncbi:RNA polymerase recycling motor HelD [Clostridium sediminicola]|uniref:RNA polymerase recycling motor HelD n=1 Tax=Clostridium sediminicola TaxID=3114879 RepID=UPI0031F2069E
MAINRKEFSFEKNKLSLTKTWIKKQIGILQNEAEKIDKNLSEIIKRTNGYSTELELVKKVKEINTKNTNRFQDASDIPYFARIDFCEKGRSEENFYIGKFGLFDNESMEEIVIDWRAPIADLYYSGTKGEAKYIAPIGTINGELKRKRKFLIKNGELKDAFDEGINEIILRSDLDESGNELVDEFLKINLEEAVSSKLKEVVSTIQKEQNDIIRADLNKPILVQGSAGSGKTTIALHRLAYLLYRYNDTMSGKDILVIAPNKIFLDYISEVLPNLGAEQVKQVTFYDLAREVLKIKNKIISKDQKLANLLNETSSKELKLMSAASKLKGMPIMKTILDRLLRWVEIEDINIDHLKIEEYLLFSNKDIIRLYARDLVYLPINKRKEEIKRYLKGRVKERLLFIEERIDLDYSDKINLIKNTINEPKLMREKIINTYNERDEKKKNLYKSAISEIDLFIDNWISKDIINIYHKMFIEKETFDKVTGGKLPEVLWKYLSENHNKFMENNFIEDDDLAPIMYLKIKIDGLKKDYEFKHIVIDEVQDYSVFQLLLINEMTNTDSMTIVGDLGQGIYAYKGISNWNSVIEDVFENRANYITLTQSYRSTVEIIEFANNVLIKQDNSLMPAKPVLRHGKEPKVLKVEDNKQFIDMTNSIIKDVESLSKNNVAIICKNIEECRRVYKILNNKSRCKWQIVKGTDKQINLDKIIIPSYMTKGLEFDCSIVYDCSEDNYGNNELDKKLLYVVLTRALHLEYILYRGKKSPLLS